MKIVIFGAGEIGRAIAQYFLYEDRITQLILVDIDNLQLISCSKKLSCYVDTTKLVINNFVDIERIISVSDLIFAAIPWSANSRIIEISADHDKPMVSVTRPSYNEIDALQKKLKKMRNPLVIGCGLEPGLTEILARYCANKFDKLDKLDIKCGGITKQRPNNILRYKALFGTRYLPIAMRQAYTVTNSKLIQVPRFSGVEQIDVPGIGQLEAWHDGMVPWLYQFSEISSAHTVSQKTLRWPGFSESINKLNELGLLTEEEIKIDDNFCISPKKFIEHLYEQETRLQDEENITLLHVSGYGTINKRKSNIEFKLTVPTQSDSGLNSLTVITGFTAALVGLSILNGEIKKSGLTTPECIIQGKQFDRIIQQLNKYKVKLNMEQDWDDNICIKK